MHYYLVSPTKIIRSDVSAFTYLSEEKIAAGTIVLIEVGKRTMTGIVMQEVEKPDFEVKHITDVLEKSTLPLPLIQTALWMSEYYSVHLAMIWQTILPKGLEKRRRAINDVILDNKLSTDRTINVFTDEQARAIETINQTLTGTILLHGVTGSGKTMVYIQAAKQAMSEGLSSIILVPEIALTSQLVAEFSKYFDNILLTHSNQTESTRHKTWAKALNSNDPVVVIGPRSALFMPVQQLGLVVIDECHEPSYKQENSPRYSALRVGSILTQQHEAKLVLGSATPSISDYFLAKNTDKLIITMKSLARKDAIKPSVQLVDMTKRQNFTQHHFLSNTLIKSIENTLANNKQVLIFHNRRGSASITFCEKCGWQALCTRCFIPLTLHHDTHKLVCHICGLSSSVPTSCPECNYAEIIHKGIGTKRIQTELTKLFPNKIIARFDGDTTQQDSVEQRYDDLFNGNIDIIIGTQVIAKGLDLPHLRTVGIIQADAGLSLPDFTTEERTFQLLAQTIGRVGRSSHDTSVIVQSYKPSHPAITDGLEQNYTNFYNRAIEQRKRTNFPPFTHLLKLVCTYKTEQTAIRNSAKLANELKKQAPNCVQVLGPSPAFYERLRDTYRWQLILKSPKRHELMRLLEYVPTNNWQYELDPVSLI